MSIETRDAYSIHTENEVVLVELSVADLLVQSVTRAEIDVGLEVESTQLGADLGGILIELRKTETVKSSNQIKHTKSK